MISSASEALNPRSRRRHACKRAPATRMRGSSSCSKVTSVKRLFVPRLQRGFVEMGPVTPRGFKQPEPLVGCPRNRARDTGVGPQHLEIRGAVLGLGVALECAVDGYQSCRCVGQPFTPRRGAAFAINEHLPRCRRVTPTRALGGFPEGPPRVVELEVGDLGDLELRGAGVEQRGGQRDRDGHEAGADREGELVAVDQRRGA